MEKISPSASLLAQYFSKCLEGIDSDGRIVAAETPTIRKTLRSYLEDKEANPDDLLCRLPNFRGLSDVAKRVVRDAILRDDYWSMALRRSVIRQSITRSFRNVNLKIPARYNRLRRWVEVLEMSLVFWLGRFAHECYRANLKFDSRFASRPRIDALFLAAGIDARTLASTYASEVSQPWDTAGYLDDEHKQSLVGVTIGIDFIVNEQGVWFIESNLNPGLMEERSRLYTNDDPLVRNLISFAKDKGYESVLFLACNDVPVDDIMAERIDQYATQAGLAAEVLEDKYAPNRHLDQTFLVPSLNSIKTLIVRSKMYHTAMDSLFHHKAVCLRILEKYQELTRDDRFRIPEQNNLTVPEGTDSNSRFPNIVCKFTERDQGQGVVFFRSEANSDTNPLIENQLKMNDSSVSDNWTKLRYRLGMEDQAPIIQRYIPSSLIDDKYLYIVRSHVFAAPAGIKYLSAHRVVSKNAVPPSLPTGMVKDARPYIVNYSLGSYHQTLPPEEEEKVREASIAIVEELCRNLETRYVTQNQHSPTE